MLFFLLLLNFVVAQPVFGRPPEMVHQDFSSQWIERDGRMLFLNGQATHTVSIFKVEVYRISLYLEKRSTDPEKILASPKRKVILLKFMRDISADQLRSAFSDGFYENCGDQCDKLKGYLDELNSKISEVREGDKIELQFLPNKVILQSNMGSYAEVNSPEFGRVLLSIWLGPSPPSSDLKKEILGLGQ